FSVTMYYHFAFLAISIALFGVSASGVTAYIARRRLAARSTQILLATESVAYAAATVVALYFLFRLHVGLNYYPRNLALMLPIYARASPRSASSSSVRRSPVSSRAWQPST